MPQRRLAEDDGAVPGLNKARARAWRMRWQTHWRTYLSPFQKTACACSTNSRPWLDLVSARWHAGQLSARRERAGRQAGRQARDDAHSLETTFNACLSPLASCSVIARDPGLTSAQRSGKLICG